MNPGSSQFASQFPDAEETMSKMESKKLQTSLESPNTPDRGLREALLPALPDSWYGTDAERKMDALIHDASIAHEQREVLAEAYKAFTFIMLHCSDDTVDRIVQDQLDALVPFLED